MEGIQYEGSQEEALVPLVNDNLLFSGNNFRKGIVNRCELHPFFTDIILSRSLTGIGLGTSSSSHNTKDKRKRKDNDIEGRPIITELYATVLDSLV